ncbi:MAG: Dabb family protein [Clostridiales bacterium]|jgi:hypothetical protein|nr:Dabb family protein [Clostridiales bacterium]
MIMHIVMFQLQEQAQGRTKQENIRTALDIASGFMKEIPTLKSFRIETNMPGSPKGNDDLVLVCEFDDLEGLEAYRVHPLHVRFGDFMRLVRQKRSAIDYIK